MRQKLGALLGAGGLLMMAASATIAAAPTYGINVTKGANPATVSPGGTTVVFTVYVAGTGTGFLQTVNVTDPLAGCTLGAKVETSGDGDAKLEQGETWTYSCTVTGVTPGTTNQATVNACHDVGACTNAAHDAQGVGSVTVTSDGSTAAPPTDAPPTDAPPTDAPPTDAPPTDAPPTDVPGTDTPGTDTPGTDTPGTDTPGTEGPNNSQDLAGLTGSPTDMDDVVAGPANSLRTIMLVISLGMLLASVILITPARPVRARASSKR